MRLSAELRREPPLPNRYLEFSRAVRGKYEQAQGYGGMSLLYASQEKEEEPEEKPWQTQITNYYKLQYLHQENVLYQQRLSFLTEILEKRLSQTVYSSVERQIDRLIKEELLTLRKEQERKQGPEQPLEILAERAKEKPEELRLEHRAEQALRAADDSVRELIRETRLNSQEKRTEILKELAGALAGKSKEQERLVRKIQNLYYSSHISNQYLVRIQNGRQEEAHLKRTEADIPSAAVQTWERLKEVQREVQSRTNMQTRRAGDHATVYSIARNAAGETEPQPQPAMQIPKHIPSYLEYKEESVQTERAGDAAPFPSGREQAAPQRAAARAEAGKEQAAPQKAAARAEAGKEQAVIQRAAAPSETGKEQAAPQAAVRSKAGEGPEETLSPKGREAFKSAAPQKKEPEKEILLSGAEGRKQPGVLSGEENLKLSARQEAFPAQKAALPPLALARETSGRAAEETAGFREKAGPFVRQSVSRGTYIPAELEYQKEEQTPSDMTEALKAARSAEAKDLAQAAKAAAERAAAAVRTAEAAKAKETAGAEKAVRTAEAVKAAKAKETEKAAEAVKARETGEVAGALQTERQPRAFRMPDLTERTKEQVRTLIRETIERKQPPEVLLKFIERDAQRQQELSEGSLLGRAVRARRIEPHSLLHPQLQPLTRLSASEYRRDFAAKPVYLTEETGRTQTQSAGVQEAGRAAVQAQEAGIQEVRFSPGFAGGQGPRGTQAAGERGSELRLRTLREIEKVFLQEGPAGPQTEERLYEILRGYRGELGRLRREELHREGSREERRRQQTGWEQARPGQRASAQAVLEGLGQSLIYPRELPEVPAVKGLAKDGMPAFPGKRSESPLIQELFFSKEGPQPGIRMPAGKGYSLPGRSESPVQGAELIYEEDQEQRLRKADGKVQRLVKETQEVRKEIEIIKSTTVTHEKIIEERQRTEQAEKQSRKETKRTEEAIRRQVNQETSRILEKQMDGTVNRIADRVYQKLENRLRFERGRRGLG